MKIGKARFGCVFGVMLALSGPLWAVESETAAPLLIAADDEMDYEDEDDSGLEEATPRPDIGQLRHWLNQRSRQRQGAEDSAGEDTSEDAALDDDDTDSELIDTGRVWKSRSYHSRARYGKRHYRGHRWHSRRYSHRHHGFWHGQGRWQGRGHRHWHGDHRAARKKAAAIVHTQVRGGSHHPRPAATHKALAKAPTPPGKHLAAHTPVKVATRLVAAPAKSAKPVKVAKATISKASAPKPNPGKGKHR